MATLLTRASRSLATLALRAVPALLVTVPALVVATPAHAAEPDAVVRAAHFSPTTPGVDVYLGPFNGGQSKIWLSNVGYGAVSPYQRLTPGLYTVSMRGTGDSITSPPVLSWTLNARPGKAYTVAGVGAGASVRGIVIGDDLTAPPPGKGRIRVIQAASRAPTVTVRAENGPVIATDARFATTTSYEAVPAGTWTVSAVGDGGASRVQTSSAVSVVAGASTSVLLLDAKSAGITLRTVLDSSSTGTTPVGSIPAGGGGTARLTVNGWPTGRAVGLASIGALTMVAGVAALRRRRPDETRGRHAVV